VSGAPVATPASRRAFLCGASALVAAPLLAACSESNGVVTLDVAVISENVAAIESGVLALDAAPAVQSVLSADSVSTFNEALTSIRNVATTVAANSGGTIAITTGQGWVRTLESSVSAALALVTPFLSLLPTPVGTIVAAVQALLPIVEAAVELVSAKPAAPALSAPQARAIIARGL